MIYAMFVSDDILDPNEDGDRPLEQPILEVLDKRLGKHGYACGQDNGWTCYAVDEYLKTAALREAYPKGKVVALDYKNYPKYCGVFGEFDPDGTPEAWFAKATS